MHREGDPDGGAEMRQCWDPFVEDMWARYRNSLPAAPDGDTNPKADQTWK